MLKETCIFSYMCEGGVCDSRGAQIEQKLKFPSIKHCHVHHGDGLVLSLPTNPLHLRVHTPNPTQPNSRVWGEANSLPLFAVPSHWQQTQHTLKCPLVQMGGNGMGTSMLLPRDCPRRAAPGRAVHRVSGEDSRCPWVVPPRCHTGMTHKTTSASNTQQTYKFPFDLPLVGKRVEMRVWEMTPPRSSTALYSVNSSKRTYLLLKCCPPKNICASFSHRVPGGCEQWAATRDACVSAHRWELRPHSAEPRWEILMLGRQVKLLRLVTRRWTFSRSGHRVVPRSRRPALSQAVPAVHAPSAARCGGATPQGPPCRVCVPSHFGAILAFSPLSTC